MRTSGKKVVLLLAFFLVLCLVGLFVGFESLGIRQLARESKIVRTRARLTELADGLVKCASEIGFPKSTAAASACVGASFPVPGPMQILWEENGEREGRLVSTHVGSDGLSIELSVRVRCPEPTKCEHGPIEEKLDRARPPH